MELNGVLRNGHIKQQNLNISENEEIKKSSLTVSDQTDEEEEGDHVTPLPGSTVNLDIVSWPSEDTDPSGQVRVTVIPSVQDESRRKSRYSTYQQSPPLLIPRPDNHLCLAITAIICCCLPFGVVGFICALQVDRTYDDGNREGAVQKSKNAKYWSMTAIVFGMLGIVGASFYLIFFHLVPSIS